MYRGDLVENVDRRNENETNVVDLTFHEINDMHTVNEQDEDIDAGTSSCKMSAAQSMFTQDLSSHETVVKNEKLTPETSTTDRDDIVTTLATENSENEWSVMDGDPSCPAASSEQLQDVASSVLPADPENAVRFNQNMNELDDIAVAKENGISDAIGKNKPSEVNPVKGNEFGLFQQDNQQPKIGDEGRNTTLVEEDSSDNNVNVIRNEETLNGEIESKQQSMLMLANPVENLSIIVGTDLDLLKVATGSCYSAPEIVEPQQQYNCTPLTEDHLAIPKEADNVYGNPITGENFRSTDTLEHMRGRGVLLETPTGFAVFIVKEPLDPETAWMHFMDIATANKDKKELLVYTKFKDVIEEKFGIACCDDDGVAGDLIWGLKNVLREFIPEEKHSITKEYYFPLSKGWNDFLLKYSISVPTTVRNSYLMSKVFLLRSLHLTLEWVPRNLRESFDKHVNGIGNYSKDNFMYVLVLARILVPELTPDYNFSKIFSSDMVLNIEAAKIFASNYQEERLTLYDRQIILGALDQLGVVPRQIESVVSFIKLHLKEIEVPVRRDEEEKMTWKDGHGERIMKNEKRSIWHPIVGLLVFGGIIMQIAMAC
ncbi:unnamed protein product [Urochloa decumbens]|uniref:Uncharacterized protein n=1 Tax=Urochloa decumbens TaxID=240449 RepID=A0ABC9D5S4_9POAL